jgi:hypothetical protein
MIKLKKKFQKKNIEEKKLRQPGLTWLTHHLWYEIGIKKLN